MHVPLIVAFAAAVTAGGCALVRPERIAAGSSIDAVQQQLGAPTGSFALPEGGRRLEFARGPFGTQTWMADFDAGGSLRSVTQVLTERRFNAIRAGMSRDEVRMAIGRPSEQSTIAWQRQVVWSYRYDSPFCQWFQVGLDERSGQVVDTAYLPDPLCDKDDITFLHLRR